MSIRTLSLIVADEVRDAPALRAAAAIARREDAHLDVCCLAAWPVGLEQRSMTCPGDLEVAVMVSLAAAQIRAEALATWVRGSFGPEERADVATLTCRLADLGAPLARVTRCCDLAIAGAASGSRRFAILDALARRSSAPLMVVPRTPRNWSRRFQRVLVAWNDSPETLRAVRSALPLLAPTARVTIVLVDPSPEAWDRSDPGGALAQWLARHGRAADVAVLGPSPTGVADAVARLARDRGAEAVVLGRRSGTRRAGLGSTARRLVTEAGLPVLMAR